jgi:hypothetical protein
LAYNPIDAIDTTTPTGRVIFMRFIFAAALKP